MKPASIVQTFSVLIGTIFSTSAYVVLRIQNIDIDTIDKFWVSLPLFAGMISTNQCIFGRLVRLLLRKKR